MSSERVCNLTAAVSALVVSFLTISAFKSSRALARSAARVLSLASMCEFRAAKLSRMCLESRVAVDSGTCLSAFSTAAKSPERAAFHTASDQLSTSLDALDDPLADPMDGARVPVPANADAIGVSAATPAKTTAPSTVAGRRKRVNGADEFEVFIKGCMMYSARPDV